MMSGFETVALNQKRPPDLEHSPSPKRIKSDTSDTESSTDDRDEESNSDASETDDDSTLSTDQSRCYPVLSPTPPTFNRHSKKSIKILRSLHDHSHRKPIEITQSSEENLHSTKKFKISFNRLDLLQEGHAIFSDQSFPFHSLCYLCGSMGNDLIYCNNCCQAYHRACLNETERPRLCPTPESWLCPNCNVCHICGCLGNSSLITCSDCKRIFHIKCLKSPKEEQPSLNLRYQIWFCPSCIKCDCGQKLISNEQNLLSLTKSLSSQQALMCTDCLNTMKTIRTNKTEKIEKCHLCEKFIEQFLTKPKPLFSLALIGNQPKPKVNYLFQCYQCQHRFHPICDGHLNEDVMLIGLISMKMICSKCNDQQRENLRNSLINYKLRVMRNTISSISSTLQIIISEETRLNDMKYYLSNLQELHQSRHQSLNLHAFINDLLIIVQRLLDNLDGRQWQAAIDTCITNQCPWFKSSQLYSTNKILLCSSTNTSINPTNFSVHRCSVLPSIDHTYALNNERILFESNVYRNNLLTSSDSLLRYMNNQQTNSFENLHQIDTRICQLCQTYADHFSPNISRLISIGINQWVHVGCILPAYSRDLDQPPPYILHHIIETIQRCQTKSKCEICGEMGGSVQCYVNDCQARFHCQCIERYYSTFDRSLQEKWNMIDGLLPNLTTVCLIHNRKKEEIDLSKMKSINLSSPVYADLSDSLREFSLNNIRLCIGSLQIQSLGNYDYLLEHDPIYPNGYQASRLFWSTTNARQKTVYHLQIQIEQTYHHERCNHQTIEHPLSSKQIHLEQLYQTCEIYFKNFQNKSSIVSSKKFSLDTKTLRHLLNNHKSERLSRVALAIVHALELPPNSKRQASFTGYSSNQSTEHILELYRQWSRSKFGRIQFTITSDDGYKIVSDNLDEAWSTIVNLVRECRDDMNLTHLAMTNEELNGHQMFGLTKSMVKHMFHQEHSETIILSNTNSLSKKKAHSKKALLDNSRLNVYQRKSPQRQRFNWLLNPNRRIEHALKIFEIDPALDYARRILLEESSVRLRLYHLHYFSKRVLLVGSSSIHGCGLFTLIDLIEGQMVIEYTGEVVRSCLTDKRERENEKKGFGCYMFTVDSMNVIDATHQGNKARFINHHCQPNCFAKTVICSGVKHIIIYALKNIPRGSELTYDYSFPEEDVKIPCHCGTSTCRMYLN